jgi:hypothetical protein
MVWSDPPNWAAGQSVGATAINKYLRDNLRHLAYSAQPERCTLWHDASINTVGNAIARFINAAYYETFIARQEASADGDTFTHSFVLAPGFVYQLGFTGLTAAGGGILDVFIDDEYITTRDFYSAASTPQPKMTGGYYYATPGRHVLKGVVNGHHASSTNYNINIAKIFFEPVEEGDL